MVRSITMACASYLMLLAPPHSTPAERDLDGELAATLRAAKFTGTVQETLQPRLGRTINRKLANLGRLLWFDNAGGLHSDNTCAGCHSPTARVR